MPGTHFPPRGTHFPGQGTHCPGQGTHFLEQGTHFPPRGTHFPGQGSRCPGQGTRFPVQGTQFPGQGRRCPAEGTRFLVEGVALRARGADRRGHARPLIRLGAGSWQAVPRLVSSMVEPPSRHSEGLRSARRRNNRGQNPRSRANRAKVAKFLRREEIRRPERQRNRPPGGHAGDREAARRSPFGDLSRRRSPAIGAGTPQTPGRVADPSRRNRAMSGRLE